MASAKDTPVSLPPSPSSSSPPPPAPFPYPLYCLFDRYDSGLALIISLGRLHEVVNARLKRAAGSYRPSERHNIPSAGIFPNSNRACLHASQTALASGGARRTGEIRVRARCAPRDLIEPTLKISMQSNAPRARQSGTLLRERPRCSCRTSIFKFSRAILIIAVVILGRDKNTPRRLDAEPCDLRGRKLRPIEILN